MKSKEEHNFIVNDKYGPANNIFYAGPVYTKTPEKKIPHGLNGTIVYGTNDVYKGSFHMGKRHGYGCLKIKNGPEYKGQWENDKFLPFIEWKNKSKK